VWDRETNRSVCSVTKSNTQNRYRYKICPALCRTSVQYRAGRHKANFRACSLMSITEHQIFMACSSSWLFVSPSFRLSTHVSSSSQTALTHQLRNVYLNKCSVHKRNSTQIANSSSIISPFVSWSCNVLNATDLNNFLFIVSQFSYRFAVFNKSTPYRTAGTANT
jgi:hypothetical protein